MGYTDGTTYDQYNLFMSRVGLYANKFVPRGSINQFLRKEKEKFNLVTYKRRR